MNVYINIFMSIILRHSGHRLLYSNITEVSPGTCQKLANSETRFLPGFSCNVSERSGGRRWCRRHSSTPPSAVVRVDIVQVVPSDDGSTRAYPRVGEVRFRGAPSPFGPSRATVAQPGDLRADADAIDDRSRRARSETRERETLLCRPSPRVSHRLLFSPGLSLFSATGNVHLCRPLPHSLPPDVRTGQGDQSTR